MTIDKSFLILFKAECTVHPFEGSRLLIDVSPEGGEYRAGSIAVFVPAAACQTYQQIRVQLLFNGEPNFTLDVEKKMIFRFSGDLVLEPHDLQFRIPIEIRFPFTTVQRGWIMLLMREDAGMRWTTALAFDGDTCQVIEQDSHCHYDIHTATLKLSHFCKYRWCGYQKENCSSSKKVLRCNLFARMNSSGDSCDFVLHFCDNCEDAIKVDMHGCHRYDMSLSLLSYCTCFPVECYRQGNHSQKS